MFTKTMREVPFCPLLPGERLFLAWMAPRGIVAAAVAPVFALNLIAAGDAGGARLVPATYFVILGTGVLYGLSAAPLARRLGLAQPCPQGVLFAGANGWARALGAALQAQGCPAYRWQSCATREPR